MSRMSRYLLGSYNSFEELWGEYPNGGLKGDCVWVGGQFYEWNNVKHDWVQGDDGEGVSSVAELVDWRGWRKVGEYSDLDSLLGAHPSGGERGDMAVVGGVKYVWDSDAREWTLDVGRVLRANRGERLEKGRGVRLGRWDDMEGLIRDYPNGGLAGDIVEVGGVDYRWDNVRRDWVSVEGGAGVSELYERKRYVYGGDLGIRGSLYVDGDVWVRGAGGELVRLDEVVGGCGCSGGVTSEELERLEREIKKAGELYADAQAERVRKEVEARERGLVGEAEERFVALAREQEARARELERVSRRELEATLRSWQDGVLTDLESKQLEVFNAKAELLREEYRAYADGVVSEEEEKRIEALRQALEEAERVAKALADKAKEEAVKEASLITERMRTEVERTRAVVEETREALARAKGDWGDSIRPITAETLQLVVGQRKGVDVVRGLNIRERVPLGVVSEEGSVAIGETWVMLVDGVGAHEITESGSYEWHSVEPWRVDGLEGDKLYYLYLKRNEEEWSWELSETPKAVADDVWWMGVVGKSAGGVRAFTPLYGITEVLPGEMRVSRIRGGGMEIDLEQGTIRANRISLGGLGYDYGYETDLEDYLRRVRDDATSVREEVFGEAHRLREEVEREVGGVQDSVRGIEHRVDRQSELWRADIRNSESAVEGRAQEALERAVGELGSRVDGTLRELQKQVDGEVSHWFYKGAPSASVPPENGWTSSSVKARHIGDTYTDIGSAVEGSANYSATGGQSWRYSTQMRWELIADNDAREALKRARDAKAVADGKCTTYLVKPVGGYGKGDLWILDSDMQVGSKSYKRGSLLHAIRGRSSFDGSDWAEGRYVGAEVKAEAVKEAEARAKALDDALQVGGRNYLLQSGTLGLEAKNVGKIEHLNKYVSPEFRLVIERRLPNEDVAVSISMDWEWVAEDKTAQPSGEVLMAMRLDFKGSDPVWCSYGAGWGRNWNKGQRKGRLKASCVVPKGKVFSGMGVLYWQYNVSGTSSAGWFRMSKPKLEFGSKATDWVPAPEDSERAIAEVGAKVEEVKGGVEKLSYLRELFSAPEGVDVIGGAVISRALLVRNSMGVVTGYINGDTGSGGVGGIVLGGENLFKENERRRVFLNHNGTGHIGKLVIYPDGSLGVSDSPEDMSVAPAVRLGGGLRSLDELMRETSPRSDKRAPFDYSLRENRSISDEWKLNATIDGGLVFFEGDVYVGGSSESVGGATASAVVMLGGRKIFERVVNVNSEGVALALVESDAPSTRITSVRWPLREWLVVPKGNAVLRVELSISGARRPNECWVGLSSREFSWSGQKDDKELAFSSGGLSAFFGRNRVFYVPKDPAVPLTIKGKTDMPGLLFSMRVDANGGTGKHWGAKAVGVQVRQTSRVGEYIVSHDIGHVDYAVSLTLRGHPPVYVISCYDESADSFKVRIMSARGEGSWKPFSMMVFGDNR